jgi:hypothetical protein
MTTPTTQQAEALWVTAHEHVRRGDFASATRDLAQCFAILQANNDPRLPEVHRRWTEVHQLAVEEAAQGRAAVAQPAQTAVSLEAEAEAAANAGNLEEAISLYERALAQRPDNELVAERLTELKNARPRAAALTSTAPVGAIDEEALAASIDLANDLGEDSSSVVGGTLTAAFEPEPEPVDTLDETIEFVPSAALREDDFGDVVPAIVRAEAAERDAAPTPTILRDEAVERSIVVEQIVDDEPEPEPEPEPEAFVAAIVRDEAVERSIVVEPIVDDEPEPEAFVAAIVRDEAVERSIVVEPIADAIAERTLSLTDDVKEPDIHDAVTLVPHRREAIANEAAAKTTAKMYLEDVGAPSKITASMYLEDVPAWGASTAAEAADDHNAVVEEVVAEPASSSEAIAGDDPRWGAAEPAASSEAIAGDDPRWGSAEPAASSAAIAGDDPRWGSAEPAASSEAIAGDDPRWGSAEPAASSEAIAGDDPRWGAPTATTAPLMAPADAPVGMPSLELDIDMGAAVSGSEADELPVDADDLMMVGDDDIMAQSLLPQPAPVVAAVLADGFPADPEAMLNAVLERVRSNRRAA